MTPGKNRFFLIIIITILLPVCVGCGEKEVSKTFFAMDTVMEVTVYGEPKLTDMAEEEIRALEKRLSVTDEESEVFRLNRDGRLFLSDDAAGLLSRALEFCAQTDGKLDISIYPIVRAWGFTTGNYRVPAGRELRELLRKVDYSKIILTGNEAQLPDGMQIDLGSVAKGYAGDQVIRIFREAGVTSALLNLGGNVQTLGAKPDGTPWKIAVKNPNGEGFAGVLEIVDKAVITSGGYERYFIQDQKTYRHIIDPETGYPADNGLLSVTIVGEEGVWCDACSTALFVMGADEAVEFWEKTGGFDMILITESGQVIITEGIEKNFSLTGAYAAAEEVVIRRE